MGNRYRHNIGVIMNKLFSKLFRLGIISNVNTSVMPDNAALFGLIGMKSNLNSYSTREMGVITTAGTASTISGLLAHRSSIRLDSGASGGFTLTLPTTATIFANLPSTVPTDGTFAKIIRIINNNVGQTATLTAGDASTTITGTATIATNTARSYLFTILSPTTVSYENVGTATL